MSDKMYFWYRRSSGELWPVRSIHRPGSLASQDKGDYPTNVVGPVVELPEELEKVPLLELCKRYPPPVVGDTK